MYNKLIRKRANFEKGINQEDVNLFNKSPVPPSLLKHWIQYKEMGTEGSRTLRLFLWLEYPSVCVL